MIADSNETVKARQTIAQDMRQRAQAKRLAQVEQELAAARAELAAMIGDDVKPALDMMREDRDQLLVQVEGLARDREDAHRFSALNHERAERLQAALDALMANVASVYVKRPDPTGNSGTDIDTLSGVKVERCMQMKGPDLWAVRCGRNVLAHDGGWEWEPQPSSRDSEFLKRCRFASFELAMAAAKYAKGLNDD